MSQPTFEQLRERLLRAGIAHRYARRLIAELRIHHQDAARSEEARGLSPSDAAQVAWTRLGHPEEIVRSAAARPELRSAAARFPVLLFGLLPPFAWTATLALFICALFVGPSFRSVALVKGLVRTMYAIDVAWLRALPSFICAFLLILARRPRIDLSGAIIGTAIIAVLAGTTSAELFPHALALNSSLLPYVADKPALFGPHNPGALVAGAIRACVTMGAAAMLYAIWLRWDIAHRDRTVTL